MVKKVKSQLKALFSNVSDPISNMGFLTTFKLPCNSNRIHEKAAMWSVLFLEQNGLATILNSYMSAATHIALVVASENTVEPATRKKLLRSYLEIVKNLLKNLQTISQLFIWTP